MVLVVFTGAHFVKKKAFVFSIFRVTSRQRYLSKMVDFQNFIQAIASTNLH